MAFNVDGISEKEKNDHGNNGGLLPFAIRLGNDVGRWKR
jgi:hypothetical protein